MLNADMVIMIRFTIINFLRYQNDTSEHFNCVMTDDMTEHFAC